MDASIEKESKEVTDRKTAAKKGKPDSKVSTTNEAIRTLVLDKRLMLNIFFHAKVCIKFQR